MQDPMPRLIDEFRQEVDAFIARHDLSDRAFSTICGLAANWMHKFRAGSGCRADTIDQVRAAMRRHDNDTKEVTQ